MKQLCVIAAALLLTFSVKAQSVQEGVKLINYDRYESAKRVLTPLAVSNDEANYYLGIAELGLENVAAAKTIFSKDLNNFYNQAGMARVLFIEGKSAQATEMLNSIVDKAKKRDWEKYKVAADAITYTKGGNIQDAIDWYKKSLEKHEDADIRIGLGDAFLKLQSGGGEAMDNFQKAIELGTNNSLAYSRIGSVWYDAHNYTLALEAYNKAKESDANNPLPYRDLAQAYRSSGNYQNSLENIEQYLAKSDKSVNNQITYANTLFLAGKYPEAQTKMEELLAQGVEKPYMYRIIAYTAYESKDYEKAFTNMNTFFSKEKDNSKLIESDYMYAGKILLAKAEGDSVNAPKYITDASNYFKKALTTDTASDKTEIYRKIADGFKDAREYGMAGEWYGKIIEANPLAAPLDYFYMGYWNFYAEKYKLAGANFDSMIKAYPNEGSGYFWRARVAAAQDAEATTGAAVPFFKTWLDFQNEENDYVRKEEDLVLAYQYLAYYNYNQKNKAESMVWVNKILDLKPGNDWAMSIKKYFDAIK